MKKSTPTQTDRLTLYAPRWRVILKLRQKVFAALIVAVSCSGCAARTQTMELTIGDVVDSSRQYDGKAVLLNACLNVTRHTMTLVDCLEPAEEVAFEPKKGNEADYRAIIDAGFKSLGTEDAQVRLKLIGKFDALDGPYPRYILSVEDVLEIKKSDRPRQ